MKLDFTTATWLHQPEIYEVTHDMVVITTKPNTDFWQRSYYGFRNDNGHALLWESRLNFTFVCGRLTGGEGGYDKYMRKIAYHSIYS